MFTKAELEEMRRADEEFEKEFFLSNEELKAARERDTKHRFNEMDKKGKKKAEARRRYYEANREKVAEASRRYYEANREKVAESKRQELKAFRKEHGLTQEEFGKTLGVSRTTVYKWENGELTMNEERIKAVYPMFEIRG